MMIARKKAFIKVIIKHRTFRRKMRALKLRAHLRVLQKKLLINHFKKMAHRPPTKGQAKKQKPGISLVGKIEMNFNVKDLNNL